MTCAKEIGSEAITYSTKVLLILRKTNGETVKVSINRNEKFQTLFHAYCVKFRLNLNYMCFKFNGRNLFSSDSVDSLRMKDNDVINVLQVQTNYYTNIP